MPITGEDNSVIGTDYGHADSATELDALNGVMKKFSMKLFRSRQNCRRKR
jgi:hypothetical protein